MKNVLIDLNDLLKLFSNKTDIEKLRFLENIDIRDSHLSLLLFSYLQYRVQTNNCKIDFVDGYIYQILIEANNEDINELISFNFKEGIINLTSKSGIDHIDLHNLLLFKKFQEADKLTNKQLYQLANLPDNSRQWLYFTDILSLPVQDILIIDQLWRIYSKGKFGFSVQHKIWLTVDKRWNLLWDKLGWQEKGHFCRYPDDFMWSLDAPPGHLPLFNQLKGNTVLSAILNLEIWN
uniref:Conserved hypothetical plastid protein n=1 Tax=Boldia erythrosiphon TaxID=74908 RepID=A0A1Y9TM22_9RHOD|nr:conserved hypothetical plastid protein [Boldia erythrosiphon]ARO90678.1 conserved hypothetical plastid protein [Boldia erythrosiphon]